MNTFSLESEIARSLDSSIVFSEITAEGERPVLGYGWRPDLPSARDIAIAEVFERWCILEFSKNSGTIKLQESALGDRWLDHCDLPKLFFSPEVLGETITPCGMQSFFVAGFLLGSNQPIHLNASVVSLLSPTTSGGALHTLPEKAIENAVMELLERHVILSSWYLGFKPQRVRFADGHSLLRRIQYLETIGVDLSVYLFLPHPGLPSELQVGLPVAVAVGESRLANYTSVITGFSMSYEPMDAIERACKEVFSTIATTLAMPKPEWPTTSISTQEVIAGWTDVISLEAAIECLRSHDRQLEYFMAEFQIAVIPIFNDGYVHVVKAVSKHTFHMFCRERLPSYFPNFMRQYELQNLNALPPY